MIAYNSKELDNISIQEEATAALEKECITAEEHAAIVAAHPSTLYTPNIFMRIGLFILTSIIMLFSSGLFALMSLSGKDEGITILSFILGIISYIVLEVMVREKKHHKSGADSALMWWASVSTLVGVGVATSGDLGILGWSLIVLLLSLWFTLRFADVSMSIIAHLAFLATLFSISIRLGTAGRIITPFLLMGASLAVYLLAGKLSRIHTYRHYRRCLEVLKALGLLTLYVSGNYLVVREVSNEMFGLDLQPGESIPGGWIFWIFTVVLPPLYIYLGLRKKDRILIVAGLILLAAIVFTIRYYHSVAPIEVAMTLGGAFMILVAYFVTKYLKEPKKGFTAAEDDEKHALQRLQIEAVIISQTMSHTPQPAQGEVKFGGGTGSGGGATGEY
ncbi:MAG TPA: hypothetical protein VJ720_12555 [Chitinophaga sp.]|nr:hypothetical protein [Chitinophaga sp.]